MSCLDPLLKAMTNTNFKATKRCRALIVVGMVVFTAAAHAQRDEAPAVRTSHYKTPCTINGYPSWCAVSAMGNIPNSLRVEFAHGDQPIFQWVPISQARDPSGGLEMREITSGTMWGLKEHGFTSLNEIGGLNSICVGKHARLPYPRGCAKP